MRQQSGRGTRLIALMLGFVAGCSGGTPAPPKIPDLVPFSGTVTMDDKPLEGATVLFSPKIATEGFHGMSAKTDSSGKYELETDIGNNKKKKGAIPGKFLVTVSKLGAAVTGGVELPKPPPGQELPGFQLVDMKYSMPGPDNLIVDIPATGGTYDIKVTSAQMPKPPGQ